MSEQGNTDIRSSRRIIGEIPVSTLILSVFVLLFLLAVSLFQPVTGYILIHCWIILVSIFLFIHQRKLQIFIQDQLLNMLPVIYMSAALPYFVLIIMNGNSPDSWGRSVTFQFWIASGFTESAGILSLILLMKRGVYSRIITVSSLLIPMILILFILLNLFPDCIKDNGSVTVFACIVSLLITVIFLLDAGLLRKRINRRNLSVYSLILISVSLSGTSFLIHLIQKPVPGIISLILKATAYHLLYTGIIMEGVKAPLKRMKETEDSLRKEQFYYTQTLAAVKDGMFRYYQDRNILDVSPVWLEMTGYSLRDSIIDDELLSRLFLNDEYEKLKTALELSCRNGTPMTEELRMCHQRGHFIWVLIRGNTGRDQNGDDCFIGMMTDISWRKKIEHELILSKDKAEESDRLKTTFLANISHEIRTPLNVILGFTGLILKDLPEDEKSDERMRSLEIVRQSSNQLISIISDIIDISRIQNEKISLQNQIISIDSFFRNIHTVYRKLMDDRGKQEIRLTWFIPPEIGDELFITTDIERFHQIWQNLLNNAMKFIEYGQIRYGVKSLDSQNNRITFFVEDTGPGISKEKDSIIFERFRQGEEGFARRYGGSGLGLTISRELLHLMGGSIQLDNDYQGGARFLFTLPESHE